MTHLRLNGASAVLLFALFVLFTIAKIVKARFDAGRARRRYDAKVGRDLQSLVALLPPDLQQKTFTSFVVDSHDTSRIGVALLLKDDVTSRGNPRNVGLEFDAETGELVNVRRTGIPLGLK